MSDVPSDAWREILIRLPAKSLIRCRAVSKALRAVIDDRSFVKAYSKKQLSSKTTKIILRNSDVPHFPHLCSFDLDALHFDGSNLQSIAATPLDFAHGDELAFPVAACDGLMLIPPEKSEQKWQIWNPTTHESLELPQGDFASLEIVATGLGFDESGDDYKAVLISRGHPRVPGKHVYLTHVYSLKSDSWRKITNFPCHNYKGPNSPGVFMGGALNWFFASYEEHERIIALDLRTETYRELKVPSLPDRPFVMTRERYLDVLDSGRLILTDFGFILDLDKEDFDVWVMKDYEVEDSWTRMFSVEGVYAVTGDAMYGLRFVAFLSNKMQLLFQDRYGFHLFDVQTSSVRMVLIEGLEQILSENDSRLNSYSSAQVVPDSIFRLHDNCGVGGRKNLTMKREESKSNVQMRTDKEIKFCVEEAKNWKIH